MPGLCARIASSNTATMQRKPDGSLIGTKGVQYGLIKPGAAAKKPAPPAAARPPAVFGDDSDEDVEAQVARQAEKKRSAAKVGAYNNIAAVTVLVLRKGSA